MNTRDILFITFFLPLLILLFVFTVQSSSAAIYGITIGDTNFTCGKNDSICPSDYVNCEACTVDTTGDTDALADDPDCCTSNSCGLGCTVSGEVCGDSRNEYTKNETDSEGDIVGSGSEEDCKSTGCTTEHVIDDVNDPACVDRYEDGTALGIDYTHNCADDGTLYRPYTYTSDLCSSDVSCHDTDDTSDEEICDEGNWHDADESEIYCHATGGTWIVTGTHTSDTVKDDYDGDLYEYCDSDDGYFVTGGIVAETYRGSGACEALEGVTVSIKDMDITSHVYDTDTTEEARWSTIISDCDNLDNAVGTYVVMLEPDTYYLVAEKDGYNTVTKTIDLSSMTGDETLDYFEMYLSAECQSDCTMNDRTCYASCDGVNGCNYLSYEGMSVAAYCDGRREGYRYVLSEKIDPVSNSIYGDEVYCCTETPQSYNREYFSAEDVETNCVENIIEREKTVLLNGEWVDIHFVIFSDPQPEKEDCTEYENFRCDVYGEAFC